jgi:hypothetical protein
MSFKKAPAMNLPPNALHTHKNKEGCFSFLALLLILTLSSGFFKKKIYIFLDLIAGYY